MASDNAQGVVLSPEQEQVTRGVFGQALRVEQFVKEYSYPFFTLVYNLPLAIACFILLLVTAGQGTSDPTGLCTSGGLSIVVWLAVKTTWLICHDIGFSGLEYFRDRARIRRGEPPLPDPSTLRLLVVLGFEISWFVVGWVWWSRTHSSCSQTHIVRMVLAICIIDLIFHVLSLIVLPCFLTAWLLTLVTWLPAPVPPVEPQHIEHLLEKVTFHVDEKNFSTSCVCCLLDFVDGAALCRLACGHTFDEACITQWLLIRGNCPTCRAVAIAVPVVPNNEQPISHVDLTNVV